MKETSFLIRYAHLENIYVQLHDILTMGKPIGKMGNTGQSSAAHLHIDLHQIIGATEMPKLYNQNSPVYTLSDIEKWMLEGKAYCNPRQLLHFVDFDLFKTEPYITTTIFDLEYLKKRGKVHPGVDVVPKNRHTTDKNFDIHWNRSFVGKVKQIITDHPGYGNMVVVLFSIPI